MTDEPEPRTRGERLERLLDRTVFVDLEVHPAAGIIAIGAVYRDASFRAAAEKGRRRFDAGAALGDLDDFASGAELLAGHNLIRHDVPEIRGVDESLRVGRLPAIDTLVLSPLAHPAKPYHALVKDYKLVGDAANDPRSDAALARRLLRDQFAAFSRRVDSDPELAAVQCTLLSPRPGPNEDAPREAPFAADASGQVLTCAGAVRVDETDVLALFGRTFEGRVCATVVPRLATYLETLPGRLALAYASAWISVAGTRSVLPRWVGRTFPQTIDVISALRDQGCGASACAWCSAEHDVRNHARRYFGIDTFRGAPLEGSSRPLQETVIAAGIVGRSLLAVLPTSFGKSLCFQLPALVRYTRLGELTIVISPLQALMKDQVDLLEQRVGHRYADAIHGMLTPPERADVLERVRDGSVALLYVSPEQLRNRSFGGAIRARRIGAWVFDEAHCVSKWGHDFRTDYHYAARFIADYCASEGVSVPAVACFTATAKRDVKDEIGRTFRERLGHEFELYEADVWREKLRFEVVEVPEHGKLDALDAALHEHRGEGSAIVYAATRRRTEEASKYLQERNHRVQPFHAGLDVPVKREIQSAFSSGALDVICATNAFGMGIDKRDVRLVAHLDIPGSLENYLQEAGRAGRDGEEAHCLLLFAEADLERQFQLLARSRLQRRDIGQILRTVRRSRRAGRQDVVLTPGEVLHDDRTDLSFDAADRDARTKVFTAVSWLERGGFLRRDDNHTRVFQGRPRISDPDEVERRMDALSLPPRKRERWKSILAALGAAETGLGLDMDELAQRTGFRAQDDETGPRGVRRPGLELLRTLQDMARQGFIAEGLVLSAFVRRKMADSSEDRLAAAASLEREVVALLREAAPDAGPDGAASPLDLRLLNDRLIRGGVPASVEAVRRLLFSLARDATGPNGGRGSLILAHSGGDRYRMRLARTWSDLEDAAEARRSAAVVVLRAILAKADERDLSKGEVLVEFSIEDVVRGFETSPFGGASRGDLAAETERSLLFLHEQRVITLHQGLALFRQAMGLQLLDDAPPRYTEEHYAELRQHYDERIFQVHAMGEYARIATGSSGRHEHFVRSYFDHDKDEFVERWFADRVAEIGRPTSPESYARIVDDLRNPEQIRIVTDRRAHNTLVLAGPGSGKTRVVVHRCAHLLMVERVPASSVLVLCFNRAAAHDIRKRLHALVGSVAFGVQVQTYHAPALRLTGRSARPADGGRDALDFEDMLQQANRLLRGAGARTDAEADVESDGLRDRLLAGYQYVLVDEYQDIDAAQYDLIGAIADRGGADGRETVLLAVGDDDQNIYSWRGADVAFLRRFEEDYAAKRHLLVENYRSTHFILAAATRLIENDEARMKRGRPLRVDAARRGDRRGGDLARLDRLGKGRVQVLRVSGIAEQAAAALGELRRLETLLPDFAWSDVAVLARGHEELNALAGYVERTGVPVRRHIGRENLPPLEDVREIAAALSVLRRMGPLAIDPRAVRTLLADAGALVPDGSTNPWSALLDQGLAEWEAERGEGASPAAEYEEHLHEVLADQRRGHFVGTGLLLATTHAAKGLEFRHVVVLGGGWDLTPRKHDLERKADIPAEQRRLLYVAMTRARHSLTLIRREDADHPLLDDLVREGGTFLTERTPAVRSDETALFGSVPRREVLRMEDVDLGYAGRWDSAHPVHRRIQALRTGDPLTVRPGPWGKAVIVDRAGDDVGALSNAARRRWSPDASGMSRARVFALVCRSRERTSEEFRDSVVADHWFVPLIELEGVTLAPDGRS